MSVELDGLHLHKYEGGSTDQCVYRYPTGGVCYQGELAHAMSREIVALRAVVERLKSCTNLECGNCIACLKAELQAYYIRCDKLEKLAGIGE